MERFIVSRDDEFYEAFPDVAKTPSDRLVCVFAQCTHHADRSYTCAMVTTSDDRGRTWSPKRELTEPLHCEVNVGPWWNCPRVSLLGDGRLVAVCDRIAGPHEGCDESGEQSNWLWFSSDEGETWDGPHSTPVRGIVPDQLIELRHGPHAGRWILSASTVKAVTVQSYWFVQGWISDDQGKNWTGPIVFASDPVNQLSEGTVLELRDGTLACFLRENSFDGRDCHKSISTDGGQTWEGPFRFPIMGCHRPVAGMLNDGNVLITHRMMQGGNGWVGWWTQNFMAAYTDVESVLARRRHEAHTRLIPIDFDRSSESDTGYSGWVQFDDDEIYIVTYIMDDAPKAHIRGYSLQANDILLTKPGAATEWVTS